MQDCDANFQTYTTCNFVMDFRNPNFYGFNNASVKPFLLSVRSVDSTRVESTLPGFADLSVQNAPFLGYRMGASSSQKISNPGIL